MHSCPAGLCGDATAAADEYCITTEQLRCAPQDRPSTLYIYRMFIDTPHLPVLLSKVRPMDHTTATNANEAPF